MGKPHVHADLIKAWADGAEIERYDEDFECWEDICTPMWHPKIKYRIKPKPLVLYCGLVQDGSRIWLSQGYSNIGILKVVIDPDTKELVSATLEK